MARLNTGASTTDSLHRDRTPNGTGAGTAASPTPTPGPSFSSDKENQSSSRTSTGKRALGDSTIPMPQTTGNKRRRLVEQGLSTGEQGRQTEAERAAAEDRKYYDPEQNPEERRKVRQGLRNNTRELHDRADEFLKNDSAELVGLIARQNALMKNVKQTADATMDSRFLLNASEITLKKSRLLAFGENAIGIDLDEFVSKCMTFMRHGKSLDSDEQEPAPTQTRRNRGNRVDDDEDEDNDGDAMNWHVLGRLACFPNNRRPTVPSFLLGPLSVEKRVRATQRRATQRREAPAVASRPQELKEADLEKNEASNLTSQCQRIRTLLQDIHNKGVQSVEDEASEDMDEDDARALFSRNNLAMNYEIPLLKFALNPTSFGQTVENLFYISFLVKDSLVSVSVDEDSGFPTIRPREQKSASEAGAARHQAIFSLDYKTWQIFRQTMRVMHPLIPHRQEEQTHVNGRGWYG